MSRPKTGEELETAIVESTLVHENVLIMRDVLGRHFKMSELQGLSLRDTCDLYVDLINERT